MTLTPRRKILVFTPHSHPSHYEREIPIAETLRARGHDVTYAVPGEDFKKRYFPVSNFPRSVLERPVFKHVRVQPVSDFEMFRNLLAAHEVLILGTSREGTFAEMAHRQGKYLIEHQGMGTFDIQNHDPDFFAVPGRWHREPPPS